MGDRPVRDEARFARSRHVEGVELVSVAYRDRTFPVHSHAEYVVGAVVAGAEELVVRGSAHRVAAGGVLRLHPDEPHANRTLGAETLRYHVLYLPVEAIRPYLHHGVALRFASAVAHDPALARTVTETHRILARADVGRLEQESAMMALARALSASEGAVPADSDDGGASIRDARTWIDAHCTQSFGLAEVAEVAGLSVFRLAHRFKATVGLSPIAYRNQQRVHRARRLLLAGRPIAEAALEVGFADQSHLTRQFQRLVGVSPKRYLQQ